MHKQIVINSTPNEVRVALMEDHQLVEISVERADARRIVGNIYKGVVTAVRPGLQAAFVDIGLDKAGFLHVSDLAPKPEAKEANGGRGGGRGRGRRPRGRREGMRPIEQLLKEGDEVVVQVTKEIIGTKGPRLSADVSLPGRFLVMMPHGDHVGVSRKIEDRGERTRLREMPLGSLAGLVLSLGLTVIPLKGEGAEGAYIIRTAGESMTDDLLRHDVEYLQGLWRTVQNNVESRPAPTLVHEDVGMIVGLVRDIFKDDINALHIDNRRDYEQLIKYVDTFAPDLKNRIQLYEDSTPIFDKFGIEAELKKSLDKKVWLNRGGFLVIEQTEALVAIDVNTGRYTGKKNQEETILRANMMAAREIPRQLRLRDIGGIIVCDFIDMENESDKRKVLNELRSNLKRDRARTKTFAVSDLGLIEMSRQRVRQSVKDQLSDECPFCRGGGQILSIDTLLNKVERLLEKVPLVSRERRLQVQAGPSLAVALQTERGEALRNLARVHGMKIDVVDDARLHREDFRIIGLSNGRDLVSELEDNRKATKAVEQRRSRREESGRREERSSRGRRGSRGRDGERRRDRDGERRRDDRDRREERREERPRREETRVAEERTRRPARDEDAGREEGGRRRRRRRGGRGRRREGREETAASTETRAEAAEVAGGTSESPRPERRDTGGEYGSSGRRRRRRGGRGRGRRRREEEAASTSTGEDRPRDEPRADRREEAREQGKDRRSWRSEGESGERSGSRGDEPREERTEARTSEPRREDRDTGGERRRRRVRRRGGGAGASSSGDERPASVESKPTPSTDRPTDWDPSPTPTRREPPGGGAASPGAADSGSGGKPSSGSGSSETSGSREGRPRRRRRRRRSRGSSSSSQSRDQDSESKEPLAVRAEGGSD